jgi:NH3-dependent NAD+ synthetase
MLVCEIEARAFERGRAGRLQLRTRRVARRRCTSIDIAEPLDSHRGDLRRAGHGHARLPAQERISAKPSGSRGASTRRSSRRSPSTPSARVPCAASRCPVATRPTTRSRTRVSCRGRLDIELTTLPIEPAHRTFALGRSLPNVLGDEPDGLTDENLQSRIRGVLMMAISNAHRRDRAHDRQQVRDGGRLLNASTATRPGGFAVIKDVPKTLVYELCRYRNELARRDGDPEPIPLSVLEKAPSAELRPDQRDDQSLPPYDVLDPLLELYVEDDATAEELIALGHDRALVLRITRLVDRASTSGARCRRGCGFPKRPSGVIGACPSPTPFILNPSDGRHASRSSTCFRASTRSIRCWARALRRLTNDAYVVRTYEDVARLRRRGALFS